MSSSSYRCSGLDYESLRGGDAGLGIGGTWIYFSSSLFFVRNLGIGGIIIPAFFPGFFA